MPNFWYTMQQKGSQNPITKNKIIVKSYTMIIITMRMNHYDNTVQEYIMKSSSTLLGKICC